MALCILIFMIFNLLLLSTTCLAKQFKYLFIVKIMSLLNDKNIEEELRMAAVAGERF